MGDIHELFVLALSLVWFAGATPERRDKDTTPARCHLGAAHTSVAALSAVSSVSQGCRSSYTWEADWC